MINRSEYLEQLISFKDKQLIKVVMGIRRCGKSTLLELFREELIKSGVSEEQITTINFEDADNESLMDRKVLYTYIKERLLPSKMNYIILDEIQHVDDWQRVVDGLFTKKNCDVYITGSNAYCKCLTLGRQHCQLPLSVLSEPALLLNSFAPRKERSQISTRILL